MRLEKDISVSDAITGNWVDRFPIVSIRPYLRLSRADRPIGTWLLFLPCLWGATLGFASISASWVDYLWVIITCGFGAFLMRGAGCTWNDYTDREFDGKVKRTASRPIPSGQVTAKAALLWMICQALLAFGFLLTLNKGAILLGVLALLPVAIYPFAKRFTWWPQLFLGIAFNWGALLGWVAIVGTLELPAVFLYIGGICWTLFYDTIYAHQDRDDDALIGIKSTARLFKEHTQSALTVFLILSLLSLGIAIALALRETASFLPLSFSFLGLWGFGWHLFWQQTRLNINDASLCLTLFRSNYKAGLILGGGLFLSAIMIGF